MHRSGWRWGVVVIVGAGAVSCRPEATGPQPFPGVRGSAAAAPLAPAAGPVPRRERPVVPVSNATGPLGARLPAYARDPLPRWAQGVCDPQALAPEIALPQGVEWPLPDAWWTRPSPCPDGGSLTGAPFPEGPMVSCEASFTRSIPSQGRDSVFTYPHGPVTSWTPEGRVRGHEVKQGGSHGFHAVRSYRRLDEGCGELERVRLSGGADHVAQWDGYGVLRAERTERSHKPMGCVRAWDRQGQLVQIAHFSEQGFVAMKRRPGRRGEVVPHGPIDYERVEQRRIQEHLAATEAALRAVDASSLEPALAAERARNLDRLHAYWTKGLFPVNDRYDDAVVPFFIDAQGTACAVGHLMIESGSAELAARVARDENNDRLAEITTPGVEQWVARSGLTAEEHARIQPRYCRHDCPRHDVSVCLRDGTTMPRCYVEQCMPNAEVAFEGSCTGYEPDPAQDCRPGAPGR